MAPQNHPLKLVYLVFPILICTLNGVAVYPDERLRKFDTVYPAAGNGHTAVKLTLQELEAAAGAEGWVDVCKEPEGE